MGVKPRGARVSGGPPMPPAVERVFDTYPARLRRKLKHVRALIYRTAAELEGVGEIAETLKWGEPAYLTLENRSGSTIRLGWKPDRPEKYFVYFNCNTRLVAMFRDWFAGDLLFEGNRAIVLDVNDPVPTRLVAKCLGAALTYHRDGRAGSPT